MKCVKYDHCCVWLRGSGGEAWPWLSEEEVFGGCCCSFLWPSVDGGWRPVFVERSTIPLLTLVVTDPEKWYNCIHWREADEAIEGHCWFYIHLVQWYCWERRYIMFWLNFGIWYWSNEGCVTDGEGKALLFYSSLCSEVIDGRGGLLESWRRGEDYGGIEVEEVENSDLEGGGGWRLFWVHEEAGEGVGMRAERVAWLFLLVRMEIQWAWWWSITSEREFSAFWWW